jgi:hypothetical protein
MNNIGTAIILEGDRIDSLKGFQIQDGGSMCIGWVNKENLEKLKWDCNMNADLFSYKLIENNNDEYLVSIYTKG